MNYSVLSIICNLFFYYVTTGFTQVSFDLPFVYIAVTNYNTVVETNSDSDDEDKLHIVEEESVTDAADCDGGVPDDDLPAGQTVLPGGSEGDRSAADGWDDEGKFHSSQYSAPLILPLKYILPKKIN